MDLTPFWSLPFQKKKKSMITLELKLESTHHLSTLMSLKCGLLWQNCVLANLGQLVLADIYNCNAIYTLQNLDRMYDNNLEPKLTLIQKARLMAFLRIFFRIWNLERNKKLILVRVSFIRKNKSPNQLFSKKLWHILTFGTKCLLIGY